VAPRCPEHGFAPREGTGRTRHCPTARRVRLECQSWVQSRGRSRCRLESGLALCERRRRSGRDSGVPLVGPTIPGGIPIHEWPCGDRVMFAVSMRLLLRPVPPELLPLPALLLWPRGRGSGAGEYASFVADSPGEGHTAESAVIAATASVVIEAGAGSGPPRGQRPRRGIWISSLEPPCSEALTGHIGVRRSSGAITHDYFDLVAARRDPRRSHRRSGCLARGPAGGECVPLPP
jgi:hypothetical protein